MDVYLGFLAVSYIFVMLAKKALSYNAAAYPPFSWRYWASLLAYLYLILMAVLVLILGIHTGTVLWMSRQAVLVLVLGLYVFLIALCSWLLIIYSEKLVRDTRYYRAVERAKKSAEH
ncbi:hypothetical protein [Streptococcus respiraculi]|uniref:hypothetical protein n=1 Tax=Streptococcus respiraculi TaxID=2021971 RepID=UPI000E772C9F|nr:hypothetical protein [Streptococcus respiraculi]